MNWIRDFFAYLSDVLFGCRHPRQTRPFTLHGQTYKVCTDCGKQIFYSIDRMAPLSRRELRTLRLTGATLAPLTTMPANSAHSPLSHPAQKPSAA